MGSFKVTKTATGTQAKFMIRIDYIVMGLFVLAAFEQYVLHTKGVGTNLALFSMVIYAIFLTLTHLTITMGMVTFLDRARLVRMFNDQGMNATLEDLPKAWAPKFTLKSLFSLGIPIFGCFALGFNKTGCYIAVITVLSIVIRAVIFQKITKAN